MINSKMSPCFENNYYNKNYDYQSQNIQLNTYFKNIGNFGIGLGKKIQNKV